MIILQKFLYRIILVIILAVFLSSCALFQKQDGPPFFDVDVSKIPDAVPKKEPLSRYGNLPYSVNGYRYSILPTAKGYSETGIASWYGTKFHRHRTSSGEKYDLRQMTAAHRTLPIPCYANITNLRNGKHVIVKINDRGPFEKNRLIDLSYVAAKKIGILGKGTGLVRVTTIDPSKPIVPQKIKATQIIQHPHIYLQVGAYSSLEHAKTIQIKAKSITKYPTTIEPVNRNRRTIYRIKVGPITTVTKSDILSAKLQAAGFEEPQAEVSQ